MGLAISRRFCQLMGGNITVESRLGEGSVFTIHLPAVMESVEAGSAPEATIASDAVAATSRNSQGRDTILVVDDDPIVWHLMSHYLAKEGFNVAVASNGKEALRKAKELHPKLITLDVLMPEMDGWKTLTALKADRDLADIPVIMLTIVDNQNKGFAMGASEFLEKPISRSSLVKILSKYRSAAQVGQVLVVDDDAANRQILCHHLRKEGWSVREAENGRVALEQVTRHRPDLIFLDLMMPEMDGFEFASLLRQQEAGPEIPIVVVTAKDITDEDHLRLNGLVERVLQKGHSTCDELLSEVSQLVKAQTRTGHSVPEESRVV